MNRLVKNLNEVFAHGSVTVFDCAKIVCHYCDKDWKFLALDFGIPVSTITFQRTNDYKLQLVHAKKNSLITYDDAESITKLLTNDHAQLIDYNGVRMFEPDSVIITNRGFTLHSVSDSVYLKLTGKK